MKLTTIFLLVCCLQISAKSSSQNITLKVRNAPLTKVFQEIKKQTGYTFIYTESMLRNSNRVNMDVINSTLVETLNICLDGQPFTFRIINKTVILQTKPIEKVFATVSPLTPILPPPPVEIHGRVINGQGEPVVNVSVMISGTSVGTTTNADGRFIITASGNRNITLEFSSVGYITKRVNAGGLTEMNVVLEQDASGLNEVVVVGYGTQKKSSLTSAVSDIKGEELTKRPVANTGQALQGLAPGVTVRDMGGAPGKSGADIRIRGITTLGNNDPLIIVDGIEQNLQDINPADIESMTVLKDAASTAIYGSRAANGVVLITTKRAKTGDLQVNYNGYYAIQKSIFHPKHMGLEDDLHMKNVASENVGNSPIYTEQQIQEWVNATDRYKYPLPNIWFDYMLKPAPQQNHSLSVAGGTDQLKTLLMVNYFDQDGIIPHSNGDKKDVRLNTDFKISKRIKLSGDFNYRLKEYISPLYETLVFRYLLHGANYAVPRYPDGTYGIGSESTSPLVTAELGGISHFTTNYGLINLKGGIDILKGLKFQTQYAIRIEQFAQKDFANAYEIHDYYDPAKVLLKVSNNTLTETRNNDKEFTLNNLLNYTANWDEHSLDALVGYSQISHDKTGLVASRQNFYNNDVRSISQGSDDSRDNKGGDFSWGLRSYFGRLTYNYADKYFIEGNARYDGSSRFTGENKFSFFPSFSGAWRISKESFWSPITNVINEFKLRASWGKSGNQTVPLYSYFETLSAYNYNFNANAAQGIILSTLANKDLTWETTTQSDIGVDAQFLHGKLAFTFDYYKKKTDGILLTLPIPATVGLNPPSQNAGIVQNKGWELLITYRNAIQNFHYTITGNVSDNQNKILSLVGTGPYIAGTTGNTLTIREEGFPIDAYIGFKVLGIFQSEEEVRNYPVFDPATAPGDLRYADINEDGKITTEDLIVIGSDIPRYTFGINMNFQYRGFDMNVFFQGVGKANAIPEGALRQMGNWGAFALDMQKDYWTPENTNARFPRPVRQKNINSQMSDFWLINTAYLKLKNLQVGYTLPEELTQRIFINKLRVYVSASNLLTFSKATKYGLDPEFPSGRLAYYPQLSLYTVGVNLNF